MTLSREDPLSLYDPLLLRVRERTGLYFPAGRLNDIAPAIQRMLRNAGVDSLDEYLARIEEDRISPSELIREIRVGETYFFREPAQFAFLRDVVLPDRAGQRKSPSAALRIWSAGCATGEEPYSLAILLEELGLGDRAHILGTDLSREALRTAGAGEYTSWSVRGIDALRARRHLRAKGDTLRLADVIRRRVSFQVQNLARDPFPSLLAGIYDFDLILCRNVLIYFDEATNADVARRLYASLAEGGWLITASSDPPLSELAPFQTVVTEQGVFYRKLTQGARGQQGVDKRPALELHPPVPPARLPLAAAPAQPRREQPKPALPSVASAAGHAPPAPPERSSSLGLSDAAARISAIAEAGDLVAAEEAAKVLGKQQPLNAELHYLHGMICAELRRDHEALLAFRRAIYVDPGCIMAHLTLALIQQRVGDRSRAAQSLRTVQRLCAALSPTDLVPLGDGACAAHVAAIAAVQENLSSRARLEE